MSKTRRWPYHMRPVIGVTHVWETRMPGEGGWIYAVQEEGTPLVKVGCTRFSPFERLRKLQAHYKI
jgi:hypothetical protein